MDYCGSVGETYAFLGPVQVSAHKPTQPIKKKKQEAEVIIILDD
jgi:hypothetical protein